MKELSSFSFNIPEITGDGVCATLGKDVSICAVFLTAIVALIYRYTGCELIKLNVKTENSDATIEIDATCVANTAYHLLMQSQLKLEGLLCISTDLSDISIELPGGVMRPVMRSIGESADSEAMILFQCEKPQNSEGATDANDPGSRAFRPQISEKSGQDARATRGFTTASAVCKFVYSSKYYSDELIQQMARHFNNILSDITERPNVLIKDIFMLDAEEHDENLNHIVGPVIETGEKCAHHLFEEQAAINPEATALICGEQRMSFEELNDMANTGARYLQSIGVGVGTIVGIGMKRCIEAIVCILAAFKTGAAYAIVNPEYPIARTEEILTNAQISLLITKSSLKASFDYKGLRIIDYDQFTDLPDKHAANEEIAKPPASPGTRAFSPQFSRICGQDAIAPGNFAITSNFVSGVTVNDVAYITATSGTGGKPKLIAGMHGSIVMFVKYSKFFYRENSSDEVSALFSPLDFGASVGMMFMPLCSGKTLVLIPDGEEKDPYKFACYVYKHKITSFIMTTALARQLCGLKEEGKKLLKSVKHIGIGGSEVTPDLLRAVRRIMPNVTITVGYALSEVGTAAFDRFINDTDLTLKENERIPLGHLLPNMRAYILDRDMNPVPPGVPGELYISASYLSRGYIGMPDLTEQRFLTNPFTDSADFKRMFRTGDMMRRRFDGEVEYIGRADSEVKIRGFRVPIGDVESSLRNHEEIEAAVVTVDKGKFAERLAAWVVRKPEAETDIPELREHIQKTLPAYMVPSVFIFMEQLPLNANGKIDRAALSFDASEHMVETRNYKGPRNQIESILTDIWTEILKLERIGIHDDFLDLGGESIQAGLISLEIRDRFNVELPMIMFIEGMTIASMAEEIYHIQEHSE